MLEVIVVGLLLIISVFLAVINWKIYQVTMDMLQVTIDIYSKTRELCKYTKKTYEVLGGEEELTTSAERFTVVHMESSFPQDN